MITILLSILKYSGCPRQQFIDIDHDCFGPLEQWWLFGLPLASYSLLVGFSLFVALCTFGIAYKLNRKFKKDLKIAVVVFVLVLIGAILFDYSMQKQIVY